MTTPRDMDKRRFLSRAEALVAELEQHLQEIEQMTAERRAEDDNPPK